MLLLVGSFVLRGVLRWVWNRATPMALGVVVGAPATVDTVARRVVTHPETRLHLVGYLSNSTEEDSAELVRLGSLTDISEVAAVSGIGAFLVGFAFLLLRGGFFVGETTVIGFVRRGVLGLLIVSLDDEWLGTFRAFDFLARRDGSRGLQNGSAIRTGDRWHGISTLP